MSCWCASVLLFVIAQDKSSPELWSAVGQEVNLSSGPSVSGVQKMTWRFHSSGYSVASVYTGVCMKTSSHTAEGGTEVTCSYTEAIKHLCSGSVSQTCTCRIHKPCPPDRQIIPAYLLCLHYPIQLLFLLLMKGKTLLRQFLSGGC